MDFTRVTVSCKEIKAMARHTMRGRWLKLAVPMILTTFLANIPGVLFSMDIGTTGFLSYLIYGFGIVLMGLIMSALAAYTLGVFRMEEHPELRVLTPLTRRQLFLKSVGLFSLASLLVLLGTICLVIPGIIALYRYSQAFYILCDHPEYTPSQCLMASAAMMKGNKGQRFTLDLSFLLWYLLPLIPVVIVMVPVVVRSINASFGHIQALTPEELQPIMADETAYAAFMEELMAVENRVLLDYMDTHPAFNTLETLAEILQLLLASFAAVFTGCASACFYELASGKLSLKSESELQTAANDIYEV